MFGISQKGTKMRNPEIFAISKLRWRMVPLILMSHLCACGDTEKITSYSSESPDGLNNATVNTTEYSGPGNAGIITTVDLSDNHKHSTNILTIEHTGIDNSS